MADQTEQINRLLRQETGAALTNQEKMLGQDRINQLAADLRMKSGSAMTPDEMEMSYTVDDKAVSMKPSEMDAARASGEIKMINNAQMGLMEIDPIGTKDIVDGLEITKQKVMAGGSLTEGESSGIMTILQTLSGVLRELMSGEKKKMEMNE